jgi:hypothetical protein
MIGSNSIKTTKKYLKKRKRRKAMIDKIMEMLIEIPDTIKCILIISAIALFWDIVLAL